MPLAASCCASSKSPKPEGPQSPGSNVSAYIGMIGKREGKQLAMFLDEDPAVMERRAACAKRLELYKQARDLAQYVDGAEASEGPGYC
ncbi:hypothetical protein GOP47_0009441 [Adiantum capillus-veneris]|uniref:Dynamin GTPase effector domain-containing protein n=1 Tax=Adiantum capillus-veneris TaxID=13818 RepID=A0A9D4UX08_ADICA|nr:hypothetical protein GOP47_0009441 [Adiantum capillus-veneris]